MLPSFQFTRPRGARRSPCGRPSCTGKRFTSRSREGRDAEGEREPGRNVVSIHAPARGATPSGGRHSYISQCFNSRAREGRDLDDAQVCHEEILFQFTRPRGARPTVHGPSIDVPEFQFTRPRGARHLPLMHVPCQICFNSRAREGRDKLLRGPCARQVLFQFTRPRGARPSGRPLEAAQGQFQFTRPRGARPPTPALPRPACSFNSRAREGRDADETSQTTNRSKFQFTRPRGARPQDGRPVSSSMMFQFTRPRGARRLGLVRPHTRGGVSIHAPARGATL